MSFNSLMAVIYLGACGFLVDLLVSMWKSGSLGVNIASGVVAVLFAFYLYRAFKQVLATIRPEEPLEPEAFAAIPYVAPTLQEKIEMQTAKLREMSHGLHYILIVVGAAAMALIFFFVKGVTLLEYLFSGTG